MKKARIGSMMAVPGILRTAALAVAVAAVLGWAAGVGAHDDPEDDGLIDGGGSSKTDCVSRFQTGLELNYPPPPKKQKELACVDGDLACDADGAINDSCTFNVGLCLADDGDMPECTPAGIPVGGVVVKNKKRKPDPDLTALQASVDALLGATGVPCDNPGAGGGNCLQCTDTPTAFTTPLSVKKGRKKIKVKVTTDPAPPKNKPIRDSDKLKLRCLDCPSASTFEHINRIIFQTSCANSTFCHTGTSPQAGLNLNSDEIGLQGVWDELITEDPTTSGAQTLGLRRILPSDPDLDGVSSSILFEKLRLKPNELNAAYCQPNGLPDGCMGGEMPPGVDTFSTGKLDLLRTWIEAGAPIDGWLPGASCGDPEDIYTPADPLPPPPPGEGFQIHMPAPPDFFVDPGTEYEGCQWIQVPPEITETMYITRVEIRMNPGSHHMITFRDVADGGPPATPTAFDPDDTACNKQFGLKAMLVASQDPEFEQLTPSGVSFAVEPGEVFGINTHYTNSFNVPIFPEVWINFWGSTTPTPKQQKFAFPGDISFSVAPHTIGEGNLTSYTHPGSTPGCYYFLSSHSHRRNIGFKIWTSQPDAGWEDPDDLIYYNTDWDHPEVLEPNPRLLLNPGDKLWFQCRWDNGVFVDVTRRCVPSTGPICGTLNEFVCFTNADCGAGTTGACIDCPLDFGFLSEDEMCFMPALYYDAEPGPTPCPF